MTTDELNQLKNQLEPTFKSFGDTLQAQFNLLRQQLPSKEVMEGLADSSRMLLAQRRRALWAVFGFAGVSLGWLLALSVIPCCRPTSWESLAIALAPALVWLGVGGVILRWLRVIR
jgi:hypothetical protein